MLAARWSRAHSRPHRQRQPDLASTRHSRTGLAEITAAPLQLSQQVAVDGTHDTSSDQRPPFIARQLLQGRTCASKPLPRDLCHALAQSRNPTTGRVVVRVAVAEQVRGRDAKLDQPSLGRVTAPLLSITAQVAQYVGELQGLAELVGKLFASMPGRSQNWQASNANRR